MILLAKDGTQLLIDESDYEAAAAHSWSIRSGHYPVASIGGRMVSLHVFLLGPAPQGLKWMHRNGWRYDNRRENLVAATQAEICQATMRRTRPWTTPGPSRALARFQAALRAAEKSVLVHAGEQPVRVVEPAVLQGATTSRLAVMADGTFVPMLLLLAVRKFGSQPAQWKKRRLFPVWLDGNYRNEVEENVGLVQALPRAATAKQSRKRERVFAAQAAEGEDT